jgi:hypothetical protein
MASILANSSPHLIASIFGLLVFGFVSSFGFRISDFLAKPGARKERFVLTLSYLVFGFVSDFGFRISDFLTYEFPA